MARSTEMPGTQARYLALAVWGGLWVAAFGIFRSAGATTATPTGTPVPCVESLAPTGPTQCCQFCPPTNTCVPTAGGSGCIQVSAPTSCCWRTVIADGVILATSGHAGCGGGEVCYEVSPYFGEIGRVNALRIGQQEFSIGQPRGGTPTNTATPTPISDGKPDLVVDRAYISLPGYTGGCRPSGLRNLALHVCIRNLGTGVAGSFDVDVNGQLFDRVDGIDSGAVVCALGPYTYPADTTVSLDSGNEVDESNEGNNEWTQFVPIPTLPPSCTPTPTATATPPPVLPTHATGLCPGDCNGDRRVTVDELVLGVSVALDRVPRDRCPNYQWCIDGQPCIAVLVDVVGYALRGCD